MSLAVTADQVRQALGLLAPPDSGSACLKVETNARDLWEDIDRTETESWCVGRQNEFASGRLCARGALESLGAEPGSLHRDEDGLPCWPPAYAGSISHSQGLAAAVAVRSSDYRFIGLDLEKTDRLSPAAAERVVHPYESSFVGSDQLRASILFSLKEAFYKAQFPDLRCLGNFKDLALEVDLDKGTACVEMLADCFPSELGSIHLAFGIVSDYIVSVAWKPAEPLR